MSLTSFAAHLAPLLLDVSLKSLVLFAVAGLASLALRRASAASRHALWLLTLGSLLCLPVFCVCLPRWSAPILPRVSQVVSPQSAMPKTLPVMGPEAAPQEKSFPSFVQTQSQISADVLSVTTQPTSRGLGVKSLAQSNGPSLANWVLLIWIGGFGACLVAQWIGLMAARSLVNRCRVVTAGPLADAAEQARRTLGVARPVSIRAGLTPEMVAVPMTFGAFRPTVLLGLGAADWPADQLRSVLLHEMAHVRRWDWLTLVLSQATCAVYWFHPLVWLTAHRLRAECEEACDDLVLNCGIPAPDYAACLLEIVQGLTARCTPAAVAMAQRREISDRLKTILNERRDRCPVPKRGLIVAVAVLAGMMGPLAALHPETSGPSKTPKSDGGQDTALPKVWAAVSDHRLATMMAGHSKWDVLLPNGVRVRLLTAVVNSPSGEVECSWAPDGTPTVPLNTQLVRTYGPGGCQFLCGIVFPSARLQNGATVSGGAASRVQGWTEGVPVWHHGQATTVSISPDSPNAWAGNWAGHDRGTLQLTVASGPKVTLISAAPTQGAVRRLSTGELLTLSSPVVHEWPALHRRVAIAEVIATLPPRFVRHLTDYDFEIIGQDGRAFRAQHTGTSEPDTSQKMTRVSFDFRTSEVPLDRIKEIRLMYRPSQTAVFHNVALRPSAPSDAPEVSPSAYAAYLKEKMNQEISLSNLRQIGIGIMQYALSHHERFPDAAHWMDQIIPYLVPAQSTGDARRQRITALFHDPAAPAGQTWSYAYNRALSGLALSKIDQPNMIVAVFESAKGVRNASDFGQSVPMPGWHTDGDDYLFADGHAKWLRPEAAKSLFAPVSATPTLIPIQGRVYDKRTHRPLNGTFVIFSQSPTTVTRGSVWPSSFTRNSGRFQSALYPGKNYLLVLADGRFRPFGKMLVYEEGGSKGKLTVVAARYPSPTSAPSDYILRLSLPSAYSLQVSSGRNEAIGADLMAFIPVEHVQH